MVRHAAEDDDKPLVLQMLLQGLPEGEGRFGVVGAIEHDRGIARDDLEPAGPSRLTQSPCHRLRRKLKPALRVQLCHDDRHRRVGDLVPAQERRRQASVAARYALQRERRLSPALLQGAEEQLAAPGTAGLLLAEPVRRRPLPLRDLGDDGLSLGLLGRDDDRNRGLENARFLGGDLLQRVAKDGLVIVPDQRDPAHARQGDIRRVETAPQARLQHDHVALLLPEVAEGQRRVDLEEAQLADGRVVAHAHGCVRHRGYVRRAILAGDHLPVDLDALAEVDEMWRRVETGPLPRGGQDRRGHRGRGALALGARDVNADQVPLGVADQLQEPAHRGQLLARLRVVRAADLLVVDEALEEPDGLVVVHGATLGPLGRRTGETPAFPGAGYFACSAGVPARRHRQRNDSGAPMANAMPVQTQAARHVRMRVTAVLNPVAGKGRAERALPAVQEIWEGAGHEVTVARAEGLEEARSAARRARDAGDDAVLAFAGDGTLSDLAAVLEGSATALAPIPCGTGNDFAMHLGLPRRSEEAARALLTAQPAQIDLLEVVEAGDPPPSSAGAPRRTRCLNIAGAGFDARVALWLNETRDRRRVHGAAAYVWGVAATLRRFRPQLTRVIWDDGEAEELETMMVAVCNARQYGGGMRIAPMADIMDGMLDVCLVRRLSKPTLVRLFPRLFRGTHVSHPCFRHRQARRVRIETDPPQPVHIDGDLMAQTPLELVVRPGALRVLVPRCSGANAREVAL